MDRGRAPNGIGHLIILVCLAIVGSPFPNILGAKDIITFL